MKNWVPKHSSRLSFQINDSLHPELFGAYSNRIPASENINAISKSFFSKFLEEIKTAEKRTRNLGDLYKLRTNEARVYNSSYWNTR